MIARRLFASALSTPSSSSTSSRQAIRTATTLASSSFPTGSSSLSAPKPRSSSTSSTATSPSHSNNNNSNSRGRSKPYRSASVHVRPRPFRPTSSTGLFNTGSENVISSSAIGTEQKKTTGRKQRRSSSSSSSTPTPLSKSSSISGTSGIFQQCQIPLPADYSFRPIPLWPYHVNLHTSFTPPHLPIMANLGTSRFLQPPNRNQTSKSDQVEMKDDKSPFDPPSPRSPLSALLKASSSPMAKSGQSMNNSNSNSHSTGLYNSTKATSLTDHLSIIKALSDPKLQHNLAHPPSSISAVEDAETYLMRIMAESDVKHQLSAEWAFESVMAKLGDKEALEATNQKTKEGQAVMIESQEDKSKMEEVLKGLDGVLAKLELSESSAVAVAVAEGRDIDSRSNRGVIGKGDPTAAGIVSALEKGLSGNGVKVKVEVIRIGNGSELQDKMGLNMGMSQGEEDDISVIEDLGVVMDSVKRKRKKKISKHKYKKRRKATRALRKRLGK